MKICLTHAYEKRIQQEIILEILEVKIKIKYKKVE